MTRREHDVYATPHWCTRALLDCYPPRLDGGVVLDPACGEGDILHVVRELALQWVA